MDTTANQNNTDFQDFNYKLSQNFESIEPLTSIDKFFKTVLPENIFDASWQKPWQENFSGYAEKYAYAAQLLYETARIDRAEMDGVTYPIMFLCRHSIELRLKSLIWSLTGNKPENKHELEHLWQKFDSAYNGEKTNEQYAVCQSLIVELHNYDKKSDTFRYHIHNNGTGTAQSDFLDIDQFYSTFLKVNRFLEGIECEVEN